jgi:predicted RNA-binding Zn ribbon-like protein
MATPYPVELLGGHPALDFLNTVHDWTVEAPRDYLTDFGDAIRFGEAAGLLSRSEGRRLTRLRGGAELPRLHRLRGSLERIFRAWVRSESPPASDLGELVAAGIEVARGIRLRSVAGSPLRREVTLTIVGAAVLRLRVADAAMGLLGSAQLGRVKACRGCGWFFLDGSKNRSRRWCSMNTCGASAKAKTYYRRRNAPDH